MAYSSVLSVCWFLVLIIVFSNFVVSFSFVLHDNLYYLSAVEWAASAMEMSAISAKNAANLISHKWLADFNGKRQQEAASNEEL